MSASVLIVAAGRGVRAAGGKPLIPKQYFPIGGVPMLAWAVGAFVGHPRVDQIVVGIHPEDLELYESATKTFGGRLRPPVPGGTHRQQAGRAGLEGLAGNAPD